jgi:hypothetical protein
MADNTTTCVNGELKPGDIVLSTPDTDYACLVGTVLSIQKAGTPEHDTENPGDDIHVNFMAAEYSENRLAEIEQMLGDLYGRPTTPGVWPPIDVDDVIMAPDMLIRITGSGREDLSKILDSKENAAAYYERVAAEITANQITPEQAALKGSDDMDDHILYDQLTTRLNRNLAEYFDTLRELDGEDIAGMSSVIGAKMYAHYYLTEIHNFSFDEMDYLLQFKDPLSVVADQFETADIDDHSDIMRAIFDRRDALQGGYEFVWSVDDNALKSQFFERLDQNLADIMDTYRAAIIKPGLSDTELRSVAERITALNAAHEYLKSGYDFESGDIEYLMQFRLPLQIVAAAWPPTVGGLVDMGEVVRDVLADREEQGIQPIAAAPLEPIALSESRQDTGEKPSVLAQLREARNAPKEPRKESPSRDRGGPEL